VVENYSNPITADLLAPHDVLWVTCCGYANWMPAELAAVSTWLQAGGAIFVHGGQAPNTEPLLNLFDINYIPGSYGWGMTTTNILPHATTEGVSAVYIDYAPAALNYTAAAQVLVYDLSNYPVAVAQEQGLARMVVMAGQSFENWNINFSDNRLLALNIMHWLASPVYSDVPWVSVEPVTGTIPAYSDQLFSLSFDATELAPGLYEMTLVLEHNDPAHGPALFIPVTLEVVAQAAAVSITANTLSQTAAPAAAAVYEITITNDGNAPDSFAIVAAGEWAATISAANTGLLAAGESFTVTATVTVPAGAQGGDSDATLITVTSGTDASVSQSLSLTTEAAHEPAVVVTADTLSQTAAPGAGAVYEITITNSGNAPDSFTIGAAGNWAATLSATNTGLLAAGESFTVTATVVVPAGAQGGDSNATLITVTSGTDPNVSQSLSLTTTAVVTTPPTYRQYLPLVVRP
jgi:hypothetical protein